MSITQTTEPPGITPFQAGTRARLLKAIHRFRRSIPDKGLPAPVFAGTAVLGTECDVCRTPFDFGGRTLVSVRFDDGTTAYVEAKDLEACDA